MEQNLTAMEYKIKEIAGRIRELRQISGISVEEMAKRTDVSVEEYVQYEDGSRNMSIAFLYRCVLIFGVDFSDLLEGRSPKLRSYALTRRGEGQRIEEAHHMVGYNLAPDFRNRIALPLYMELAYQADADQDDIELVTHYGQECDIVIRGHMKIQIGDHCEVLHPGDCIYYDSSTPHGMIAVDGEDCAFYAIVLSNSAAREGEQAAAVAKPATKKQSADAEHRVYRDFIIPTVDAEGNLTAIDFKNEEKFNFAFDVIDKLGETKPERRAMLHISNDGTERTFTFKDMKKESARAANYFKAMGIKRGDRVMLVLKRHYQFWFAVLGLHKLGAVAIPATNQLKVHDFVYRYNAAGVSAILCTADGDTAELAETAAAECPQVTTKILVGGSKEGWHDLDAEYGLFTRHLKRPADAGCGEDIALMFFTSGTTGNPKMAAHKHTYALGHYVTAKYWHCCERNGLHLTISDTGWGKSLWGKLYGQWLCEGAVFVYDFDRFDENDILPMFAKYNITTFCAPPTMLRMLIRGDLSKYDLSSIHHMTTAGEALNPEVFKKFKEATGLEIMEGFGQTETTLTIANLAGTTPKLGSMGKTSPQYDIDIVDSEGKSVAPGEVGEIVIHTDKSVPCGLYKEYYLDEEKTQEAWYDGMYHTGDTAWRDEDGYIFYVSRIDDVIKSSGYRIGPFEIESVIMELPYVVECGVSAVPDPVRGQVVKASIVLTKGTEGTEELKKEIQNYVKENTAPYKYPRVVVFRDSLPKTISGKIQRNKL